MKASTDLFVSAVDFVELSKVRGAYCKRRGRLLCVHWAHCGWALAGWLAGLFVFSFGRRQLSTCRVFKGQVVCWLVHTVWLFKCLDPGPQPAAGNLISAVCPSLCHMTDCPPPSSVFRTATINSIIFHYVHNLDRRLTKAMVEVGNLTWADIDDWCKRQKFHVTCHACMNYNSQIIGLLLLLALEMSGGGFDLRVWHSQV